MNKANFITKLEEYLQAYHKKKTIKELRDIKTLEKVFKNPPLSFINALAYELDISTNDVVDKLQSAIEISKKEIAVALKGELMEEKSDIFKPEDLETYEEPHDINKLLEEITEPEQERRPDYEEFVTFVYESLDQYGKTPIELTYDLLNKMARELYRSVPTSPNEDRKFDFQERPGEQIRALREHLGIGQRELERALGISHRPVSDIERGKYTPSLKKVCEILEALRTLKHS